MPILQIRGVTKNFGGLRVLDNVGFDVHQGEILGLIGPNGAGKTTLFNIISGFLQPEDGRVIFKGENLIGLKPHVIARKGLMRTFQLITLWADFTVMDAMRVALQMKSGVGFFSAVLHTPSAMEKETQVDKRAMEILKFAGMDHLRDQVSGTLSHGWQRTLSLCIGIATNPPLILLDEPVTALSPERVNTILDLVKKLREEGSTIMIIEHNMRAIFAVCNRIAVINYGNKIAEGTPSQIKNDPLVISAYLGVKKGVT